MVLHGVRVPGRPEGALRDARRGERAAHLPSVTLSQPLMSISQTKSEPAASSAKHTTAAVSSAMRRRSLRARSAPPRELILASSHWLRAAIAAAAE